MSIPDPERLKTTGILSCGFDLLSGASSFIGLLKL